MSWQTEMTLVVRYLINDIDSTQFSDARLQQTILVAAQLVQNELSFNTKYTVDIIGSGISPDPTNPRDDNYISLTSLKTACIIDRGTARSTMLSGARITHNGDTIDTTASAKGAESLLKNGYCAAYEQAKFEYLAGNLNAGEAILGPYTTLVSTGRIPSCNRGNY